MENHSISGFVGSWMSWKLPNLEFLIKSISIENHSISYVCAFIHSNRKSQNDPLNHVPFYLCEFGDGVRYQELTWDNIDNKGKVVYIWPPNTAYLPRLESLNWHWGNGIWLLLCHSSADQLLLAKDLPTWIWSLPCIQP